MSQLPVYAAGLTMRSDAYADLNEGDVIEHLAIDNLAAACSARGYRPVGETRWGVRADSLHGVVTVWAKSETAVDWRAE